MGLQGPLPLSLIVTHQHIVRLGDPIQVPWQNTQLVATKVASNQVWVRGWAIVHVTQQVMQIKFLVIVVPPKSKYLEVASAAPILAVAMGLQPELPINVSKEGRACVGWYHTLGA